MRWVRACSLCLRRFDGGPSPRPRPVSDARHATHGTSSLLPARSPPGGTSAISRTQHGTVQCALPGVIVRAGFRFVSFPSRGCPGRGKRQGREETTTTPGLAAFFSFFIHAVKVPTSPSRSRSRDAVCCRPPRPPRSQLVYAFRCHCMGCGSGSAGEGGWGGGGRRRRLGERLPST